MLVHQPAGGNKRPLPLKVRHPRPLHARPLRLDSPGRRHPDAPAHGGLEERQGGGESFCPRPPVCHLSPIWLHSQVVDP